MIRTTLLLVLLGLGLSFNVSAAEQKARGFYVGGSLGSSTFDDDGAFTGLNFDDSDSAVGIFGGYKFLKYFAVEGRFTDLGKFTVSDGITSESVETDALSVHAVGIVPFGTSGWEIFGQLGLGKVGFDCDGCSDESAGSAGLGVRWYVLSGLALGLQVDAFAWEEDDGFATYDVGIGATQFSIHYLF